MVLLSKKLWMSSRDYVIIVLALCLFGFGFSAFILPEKVVMGGVTGIGTIAYLITGKTYMIGVTQYAINLALLGFAYFIVGKQFVIKTIFGATVVSAVVTIMPPLFDGPLVPGQPFMNVCLGAILTGIALGLVFIHNGSTGGTDIVAAIVAKRTNVTIGRTMLYVDFGIISSSYLFTHDVAKVLYGFVVLIMNGMGWYTKHDIKILLIVCRKIESVTIFRIVKSIDQTAFITQANVNGVYGQGFDELKFKQDAKLREEFQQAERIMESGSAPDDVAAAPSATQP